MTRPEPPTGSGAGSQGSTRPDRGFLRVDPPNSEARPVTIQAVTTDLGPGAGHQFHFSVTVQAASYVRIGGDPEHYDSDVVSEPFQLTVRAWDLPAACQVAANTPLHQWNSEARNDDR